jgi:tetratricopeptide (TPR) repeat protein
MNAVDCNKCSKPIKLAPIPKKSPGIFCRCPACSVLTWVYRPTQKEDVFKALADLVKERAKVCTSCQQKFYDLHNNGTKQCFCCNPTANTAKSSQVQVNRGEYYVYNSNTDRNGPFTLENLGQEIVAGRVRTIDVIGIPDGRRLPLVKIPELIPYLKEFTNGGNNKLLIIKEKRRYTKEIGISFVVLTFITLSTLTYFDIKKGENGFIGVLARDLDIKTLREIASSHSVPKIDQVSSWRPKRGKLAIFSVIRDQLTGSTAPATTELLRDFNDGLAALKTYSPENCSKANNKFNRLVPPGEKDPDILALESLALTCKNQGDVDPEEQALAMDFAKSAVDENPDSPEAHIAMGDALYSGGEVEKSTASLEKALQLHSNNAMGMTLLARNLLQDKTAIKRGLQVLKAAQKNKATSSEASSNEPLPAELTAIFPAQDKASHDRAIELLKNSSAKLPSLSLAESLLTEEYLKSEKPLAALKLYTDKREKKY